MLEESSTYQGLLEKGAMRSHKQILLRLGRKRFGAPDATTETAIQSIQDMDRLDRLIDAFQAVGSWQELLATP